MAHNNNKITENRLSIINAMITDWKLIDDNGIANYLPVKYRLPQSKGVIAKTITTIRSKWKSSYEHITLLVIRRTDRANQRIGRFHECMMHDTVYCTSINPGAFWNVGQFGFERNCIDGPFFGIWRNGTETWRHIF